MMCVCGFVYVLAWVKFAEIVERALQTRALGPADWSPGLCRQEALVCGLLCVVYVCVVCLSACLSVCCISVVCVVCVVCMCVFV